jgi:hypothetical protein
VQTLIEQALLLNSYVSEEAQKCLMMNISCFQSSKGDAGKAKLYQQASRCEHTERVSEAAWLNNQSVMDLKAGEFESALATSRKAFTLLEPDLLQHINSQPISSL